MEENSNMLQITAEDAGSADVIDDKCSLVVQNHIDISRSMDSVYNVVDIMKTRSLIAKKETDLYVYTSKAHTESQKAYINSLLEQKRKADSKEEIEELNCRIENTLASMQVSEQESRRMLDENPYHRTLYMVGVFILIIVSGGLGLVAGKHM